MLKINQHEKILAILLIVDSLIFFNIKISQAQQYESCSPANPNYCTECRDESKRDFARCGEINYTKVNLLKSDRRIETANKDIFEGKIVFVASIGNVHKDIFIEKSFEVKEQYQRQVRYEIFIANEDGSDQKRLTYSQKGTLCGNPSFITDSKRIVYTELYPREAWKQRFSNEKFEQTGDYVYRSDYTLVIPPFVTNVYLLDLSNGSKQRITLKEEVRYKHEGTERLTTMRKIEDPQLKKLKADLDEAIKAGDYEKASKIKGLIEYYGKGK